MLRRICIICLLFSTTLLIAGDITRKDAVEYYKKRHKILRSIIIFAEHPKDHINPDYNPDKKYVTIHLIGKEVIEEDLKYIRYFPEVDGIILDGAINIKDQDMKYLSDLPKLDTLDFENTKITGEGFKYLSNLPVLERLDLTGTRVTDRTIQELKKFKTLKYIKVFKTRVTQKGVKRLEKELPDCNIVTDCDGCDNNPE